MALKIAEADRAFADDARTWLEARLPADLAYKVRHNIRLSRDDLVGWQQILAERNWYAIGWSREMGGPGLSPVQRYLFERAYGSIPAPHPCQFGISMAGPVIHAFGNDAQRARYLPDIRTNRTFWCQGYSEPGSGSDLASLKTRAVRDGGGLDLDLLVAAPRRLGAEGETEDRHPRIEVQVCGGPDTA